VIAHGTRAINIDGCRIGSDARPVMVRTATVIAATSMAGTSTGGTGNGEMTQLGRWPANVVLSHSDDCGETCADGCAVAMLDEQSAPRMHSAGAARAPGMKVAAPSYVASSYQFPPSRNMRRFGDKGGASRFFYVAKGSPSEKSAGLDGRNDHPAVKSIALMRWLIRLITPRGGQVLDPFAGSGTTMIAARLEGASVIGIEQDRGHADKAVRRLLYWCADCPDRVSAEVSLQ